MLTSCPGTVDQKKPLQSGSSNIYGTKRVKSRTQFKTENRKKKGTVTKQRQGSTLEKRYNGTSHIYFTF